MVLESLLNPLRAERKPVLAMLTGFVYAIIALFLSLWIFEDHASLVMVFLAVMAALPLVYQIIIYEEEKDIKNNSGEKSLLKEHSKALTAMMMIFVGMAIAFTLLYIFLPTEMANSVFKVQTQTIANLNQQVTGQVSQPTLLSRIFLNYFLKLYIIEKPWRI